MLFIWRSPLIVNIQWWVFDSRSCGTFVFIAIMLLSDCSPLRGHTMKKLKNEADLVRKALRVGTIYVEKRNAGKIDMSDPVKKKIEYAKTDFQRKIEV